MPIGCDESVTYPCGLIWHDDDMLNTLSFLRIALKRHGLWLLAASIAVFAIQIIAVSLLALGDGGYPWQGIRFGFLALILGLSVSCGLALLAWLHRSIMSPVSSMIEEIEQLLDRARLMQTAMQPALKLLGDGIDRQGRMVDSLRRRMDPARPFSQGMDGDISNEGDRQHAFFVSTLNNLRVDMTSRREVARTLSSASESIGLRLCEIEYTLAQIRSMLSPRLPSQAERVWESEESVSAEGGSSSYWADEGELSDEPSLKHKPIGHCALNWTDDDSSRPLMPEFKFPDETAKRRFKMP